MNLVNSIEEFKEKYDGGWIWFIDNQCSIEVLEYYLNNHNFFDNMFNNIILNQPLTDEFIIKYKDKIEWVLLFNNTNISLTYTFLENHLYHFNLYLAYHNLRKKRIFDEFKIKEVYENWGNKSCLNNEHQILLEELKKKYPYKYQIDKLQYELSK